MNGMLKVVKGHLALALWPWWLLFLHFGSSSVFILSACWNVLYFELVLFFRHIQLLMLLYIHVWLHVLRTRIIWALCYCRYGIFLHLAFFGYSRLEQQIRDDVWVCLSLFGIASVLLGLKDWNQCWFYEIVCRSLSWYSSVTLVVFLFDFRWCRPRFFNAYAMSECDEARVLWLSSRFSWKYILATISIKSILIAESPIYCQLYTPIFHRPMILVAVLLQNIHSSTSSFHAIWSIGVAFSSRECLLCCFSVALRAMKLFNCINSCFHINDLYLLTLIAASLASVRSSFAITSILELLNLLKFQWAYINFGIEQIFTKSFSNPSLNSIFELVVHDQLTYLVVLEYFVLDGSDSVLG